MIGKMTEKARRNCLYAAYAERRLKMFESQERGLRAGGHELQELRLLLQ